MGNLIGCLETVQITFKKEDGQRILNLNKDNLHKVERIESGSNMGIVPYLKIGSTISLIDEQDKKNNYEIVGVELQANIFGNSPNLIFKTDFIIRVK